MAVSGGEATLNRPWLVAFFQALRDLNPDPTVHIHLDTNGSILTPGYLDELVEAGMTDCGIDLKGLSSTTFQKISGFSNPGAAHRYLRRAWEAVAYLRSQYYGKVFVGVGVPYNPVFMTDEELAAMGRTLVGIDPDLQVTLLDYRPAFRWMARGGPQRPTVAAMSRAGQLLQRAGLKTVLCQTEEGLLGPGEL
jgi:pyruvate formate lyase activating enzyme